MKIIDQSNVHEHLLMRTWTFEIQYFLSFLFSQGDAFVAKLCFLRVHNNFVSSEPSENLPHVVDKRLFVCAIDEYIVDVLFADQVDKSIQNLSCYKSLEIGY